MSHEIAGTAFAPLKTAAWTETGRTIAAFRAQEGIQWVSEAMRHSAWLPLNLQSAGRRAVEPSPGHLLLPLPHCTSPRSKGGSHHRFRCEVNRATTHTTLPPMAGSGSRSPQPGICAGTSSVSISQRSPYFPPATGAGAFDAARTEPLYQVNLEELEEMQRLRKAAQEATDDGMPIAPDDVDAGAGIRYRRPRHWVKYARKWLGTGGHTLS